MRSFFLVGWVNTVFAGQDRASRPSSGPAPIQRPGALDLRDTPPVWSLMPWRQAKLCKKVGKSRISISHTGGTRRRESQERTRRQEADELER